LTFKDALIQILIADVSMSLDNVLAVAGAAREHPGILVFGLILSIALMGVAAHAIARLLHRYRWIGYVGLLIVLYVALHMMWQGGRDVIVDLGYMTQFNANVPDFLDIQPKVPATAH
jgi:predicted tellurium resistance membrane protein TerC